jgi:hypothetical protein
MTMSGRTIGRTIAALLLVQMALAPVVNFRWLSAAMSAQPGFLENAALHAPEVHAALLLALALAAIGVAIAILVLPWLEPRSRTAGLLFLALSIAALASTIGEGILLRGMLALSQAYAQAGAGTPDATTQLLAGTLRAMRLGAHFTTLLLSGIAFGTLFLGLWRERLIPRGLAVFCSLMIVPMLLAVIRPLLGQPMVMALLAPMGIGQFAFVGWLLVRGFADQSAVSVKVTP